MNIKKLFEKLYAGLNESARRAKRRIAWGQGFYRLRHANESIWFFGCSNVVGVGVDHEEVSSYLLEKLSGVKVLNFGLCACGPMAVKDEIYKLLDKGYTPKGIIIAWPSSTRWQHRSILGSRIFWNVALLENNKIHNNHSGSRELYPDEYLTYKHLALSGEVIEINKQVINDVRDRVKNFNLVEFTFNQIEDLDVAMLTPELDRAQDNAHPGPLTHRRVAEILNEEIKKWN